MAFYILEVIARSVTQMQVSQQHKTESAQALEAFLTLQRSKGLTKGTLHQYRIGLDGFEDWRQKPYEELTQLDMVKYVNILREGLVPTSVQLRLFPIKAFLRWYLSGGIQGGKLKGNYPDCVSEITIKKRRRTKPDVFITPEILEQYLGECRTLQQKVYFAILYDTGARRSEVLNLKIKDVQRDENGLCVELNGKTGYRKNWLHESIPLVMPYINSMSSNPDDWVFNTTYTKSKSERRSHSTIDTWSSRIVERLKKRGVISPNDKLRIHSFRHTKARNLKKLKWSNDEINIWMGWSKNSNMATHYGQAREEDIVHRFREDTGRVVQDETEEHRTCPVCQSVNGTIAKFCNDCGNALRPEFAARRDQQHSIKVQAELHQARQLIKQIKSSTFLTEQLNL